MNVRDDTLHDLFKKAYSAHGLDDVGHARFVARTLDSTKHVRQNNASEGFRFLSASVERLSGRSPHVWRAAGGVFVLGLMLGLLVNPAAPHMSWQAYAYNYYFLTGFSG